jgi:hypothetical protein
VPALGTGLPVEVVRALSAAASMKDWESNADIRWRWRTAADEVDVGIWIRLIRVYKFQ